ncbi:MAG TPA: hypothetical protein VGS22_24170 [Thermoanaerobaculia bacterium]|jgi:hypothetical protein|nr:hypothetical protein [Thermoanaerobaculia bacterium]
MRRLLAGLDTDAALYFALVLLVWGVTVPLRGLWQDDTLLLRLARDFQGHGWAALFTPVSTPLRLLYSLPFRLALETPQPVWTLHLLFGLTWLGQGLTTGWITRLLLPGHELIRFLAICLTLTATSDYLTDNLTALGYNIAALALLLAIGCGLRYLESGRLGWLALSCAAAAISIWTVDVAFPAVPFVPLLLLWRGGPRAWRRLLLFILAWGVTLAPAARAEWRFLHWTVGYGVVAMKSMPLAERVARAGELWCENFEPWRWAFAHPIWYLKPPAVIPLWAMGLAAGVGALWFAFRARRAAQPQVPPSASTAQVLSLVGGFSLMALIANAAYAGLQMAEIHYRTHILSRIWASLALAVAVGWAVHRWPRFRAAFLLVPICFVGFGVWGGLERQDLWVSTWRLHQKELLSIVTNAPALVPGTSIILRGGHSPDRYIATEAEYLAQSWLILLYDNPAIHVLRLSPERGAGCRAAPDALECWRELKAACFAAGTCPPDEYPYDKLVLMDFDEQEGVYRLLADPRGDDLFESAGSASTLYRPDKRIIHRPLTPRQRALVLLR